MSKPTDPSDYPPALFSVIDQISRTGSFEVQGTLAECSAFRFDIYGFRRALMRAHHPDALKARQTSWYLQEQPDGSFKVIGLRKDHGKLAQMARLGLLDQAQPVFGPSLPELPTGPEGQVDAHESAIEKLYGFTKETGKKPRKPESQVPIAEHTCEYTKPITIAGKDYLACPICAESRPRE